MKTLAGIGLWLIPAVLVYRGLASAQPPGHEAAELGTALHGTGRSGRATRRRFRCSTDCSAVGSSWRAIASPIAPAVFVTAMLLAVGAGACHGTGRPELRPDERIVQDHCPLPAAHGRSRPADRVPGAVDGAVDPGAPAVDARSPLAAATRGKSGAGFAHLAWNFWPRSAKRGWASMRPSRGSSIR